jgi:hypothetical protein
MIFVFMFLSGLFGRMGGAKGYDTKWRDLGCPAVFLAAFFWYFGWAPAFWWAYLAAFVLMFGALTTYWDEVFGYDNMWFSGAVVGVAAVPLLFVVPSLIWVFLARVFFLALWWGGLNKWLPAKTWKWDRAVVEEFCRYAVTL